MKPPDSSRDPRQIVLWERMGLKLEYLPSRHVQNNEWLDASPGPNALEAWEICILDNPELEVRIKHDA